MVDTTKIPNGMVRRAIEALQSGDSSWYNYFIAIPEMTDDGCPIDFHIFFGNILGIERFLSIDRVENDGKDIYGLFKIGELGTFNMFFRFHQQSDGKFDRLEIGQSNTEERLK